MKLGYSEYIPKGKLERFNKKSIFLKNVREVIREANILKDNGTFSYSKLKKIFPQRKWRYDPFEEIRVTVLINPKDYVLVQDILEETTGHLWEFDKFLKMLIYKFIKEEESIKRKESFKNLYKFESKFNKYYSNIMGSWKE